MAIMGRFGVIILLSLFPFFVYSQGNKQGSSSIGGCADIVINAGDDDEISSGQTFTMNGSHDNATRVWWTTDGTGNFNDTLLLDAVYTPSIMDVTDGEIVLTLYARNRCDVDNDAMTLTITGGGTVPSVYAGYDTTITSGITYKITSSGSSDCDSINWFTDGDGTWDDHEIIHPTYTHGSGDFVNGSVELKIVGYLEALSDTDVMVLTIAEPVNVYYVKTGGNDANTGLSDAQAWANHPWMSSWTGSTILEAGDTVKMKRGDTWTKSTAGSFITVGVSGTAGNPIVTTAYGTGDQPLIQITLSSTSGYAVIYANAKSYLVFDNLHLKHNSSSYGTGLGVYLDGGTNPIHHITIKNCEINDIPHSAIYCFKNTYNIVIGDTTATETATTESYSNHIHDFGYAGVILQGSNPATGETHSYVYYNYIHDATRTVAGSNEYGISFTASSASYSWPKYAYCRYNNVQNIKTWEAIGCHGGSYIYYQDNYIKNFGTCGFMLGSDDPPAPKLEYLYVERNIIEQPTSGWVAGRENAFILHFNSIDEAYTGDIYIRDNEIFYTSRPSSAYFFGIRFGGNLDGMEISGNKIYNGASSVTRAGILMDENYNEIGNENVVIEGNYINEWGQGISMNGTRIAGDITISNNIISNAHNYSFYIEDGDIPSGGNLMIYHNTFLVGNYPYVFRSLYGIASGGSVIAKNNIFGRAANGSMYYWYWTGTISGTFESDYNIYWNSSTSTPFYYAGSARNWAAWEGYGFDVNSPNVTATLDPEFINAGGSYLLDTDFQIPSDSDAESAGTDLNIETDYFGNARGDTPDIGAHEYNAP